MPRPAPDRLVYGDDVLAALHALGARVVALAAIAASCASIAGCARPNTEACAAYVEKVNVEYANCGYGNITVDEATSCPAYLDRGGSDCNEYYDCLAANIECRCPNGAETCAQGDGAIVHQGEVDGGPDDRRCTGCT